MPHWQQFAQCCLAGHGLDSLTLNLNSASEVGSPLTASNAQGAASNGSWLSRSKLSRLFLCIPAGDPPFHIRGKSTQGPHLDLSGLSALELLVLRGPIVKDSLHFTRDEMPFALPSSCSAAKVNIPAGKKSLEALGLDELQQKTLGLVFFLSYF